jgi:hypothetical protein
MHSLRLLKDRIFFQHSSKAYDSVYIKADRAETGNKIENT